VCDGSLAVRRIPKARLSRAEGSPPKHMDCNWLARISLDVSIQNPLCPDNYEGCVIACQPQNELSKLPALLQYFIDHGRHVIHGAIISRFNEDMRLEVAFNLTSGMWGHSGLPRAFPAGWILR
jgi:hypothetical protein